MQDVANGHDTDESAAPCVASMIGMLADHVDPLNSQPPSDVLVLVAMQK
jgi:hypothetical protein